MLQIGSRVHCILYGGRDGIVYAIKGEQRPETCQQLGGGAVVMGGNAWFDIVFDDGSKSNVPESIVYGVQWKILPGIADDVEIAGLLGQAVTAEAERKAKADEAAKAHAAEVERIKREHQHLEPGSGHVVAGRNIRTELKRAFLGVKFSVRGKSYSGGCSIDVFWTDGPTTEQVKPITDKYQHGDFNGMEDIYEYRRCPWTDVFGSAGYVFEHRDYSDRAIACAIRTVWTRYAGNLRDIQPATVEDFKSGKLWSAEVPGLSGNHTRDSQQALINIELSRRTWALGSV